MAIDSIDPTTPAPSDLVSSGDNEIRTLKQDIVDSFPSIGAAAVTSTAGDLSSVESSVRESNYVTSAFGRTGVVVATASDYDANQIDYDNSTSGLTATEVQAAIDEIAPIQGEFRASVAARGSTNTFANYYSSPDISNVPAALGTVTNDAANGFSFTAAVDCLVSIHASHQEGAANTVAGITRNGTLTQSVVFEPDANILSRGLSGGAGPNLAAVDATFIAKAGEIIAVQRGTSTVGNPTNYNAIVRMTVKGL